MISALAARSAIIRATRSTRWKLRADQPSRVVAACRKREAASSSRQCRVERVAREPGVARALAGDGDRPGGKDPLANHAARLAVGRGREPFGIDRGDLDLQVDAVEQRPADARLIAQHRVGCAAAGLRRIAELAAGAGVHGGDELEAGRELGLAGGARNDDAPGLERLA